MLPDLGPDPSILTLVVYFCAFIIITIAMVIIAVQGFKRAFGQGATSLGEQEDREDR